MTTFQKVHLGRWRPKARARKANVRAHRRGVRRAGEALWDKESYWIVQWTSWVEWGNPYGQKSPPRWAMPELRAER